MSFRKNRWSEGLTDKWCHRGEHRILEVSTADQEPALQLDALSKVACVEIFQDKASGAGRQTWPAEGSFVVRTGDTLFVWKLDRLGWSLPHLIETVSEL